MPTNPDRADWDEQAAFMRSVGAVHAEWETVSFVDETQRKVLTKLVLGPPAAPAPKAPPPPAPPKRKGVAAALLERHNTMFAASRFKPEFKPPTEPEDVVPRAVRAKKASASSGTTKVSKRST